MVVRVGVFVGEGFETFTTGGIDYCNGFADAYVKLGHERPNVLDNDKPCRCGTARTEFEQPEDEMFEARYGCLRCDSWDNNEVTLKRK